MRLDHAEQTFASVWSASRHVQTQHFQFLYERPSAIEPTTSPCLATLCWSLVARMKLVTYAVIRGRQTAASDVLTLKNVVANAGVFCTCLTCMCARVEHFSRHPPDHVLLNLAALAKPPQALAFQHRCYALLVTLLMSIVKIFHPVLIWAMFRCAHAASALQDVFVCLVRLRISLSVWVCLYRCCDTVRHEAALNGPT